MSNLGMINRFWADSRAGVYWGMLGCWLVSGVVFAGDPIIFVRRSAADSVAQLPTEQIDSKISTALDSVDTPSPTGEAMMGPAFERPRPGREPHSRRAGLARHEKENWIWYDEGELQDQEADDRALGGKYAIEADEKLPGERDRRRPGLRQSASGRQAEERESKVPRHLLSPSARQRIQAEAVAMRRARSEMAAEEASEASSKMQLEAGNKVDLGKLLAPSEESPAVSPVRMQDLLGSAPGLGSRSSGGLRTPAALGSGGGSEVIGGLDLGPVVKGPNFGAWKLDRTATPEMRSTPASDFGPPRQSFGEFPSSRGPVSSLPSIGPTVQTPTRAAPSSFERSGYAPPRRW